MNADDWDFVEEVLSDPFPVERDRLKARELVKQARQGRLLSDQAAGEMAGERSEMTDMLNYAFWQRNMLVAMLAHAINAGGFGSAPKAGVREDPEHPGWLIVFLDVPVEGAATNEPELAQASFHFAEREAPMFQGLPRYEKPWDGHDADEKWRRLARWLAPAFPVTW